MILSMLEDLGKVYLILHGVWAVNFSFLYSYSVLVIGHHTLLYRIHYNSRSWIFQCLFQCLSLIVPLDISFIPEMFEHNLFETRPDLLLYLGETRDHVAQ